MQTYKSLQTCRGVAALLVVLHHLSGAIADDKYFGFHHFAIVLSFGGASGVAFFFVLSGFIIVPAHGADFGRSDRLRSYLLKRAIRIYPTYWIIYCYPGSQSRHCYRGKRLSSDRGLVNLCFLQRYLFLLVRTGTKDREPGSERCQEEDGQFHHSAFAVKEAPYRILVRQHLWKNQ